MHFDDFSRVIPQLHQCNRAEFILGISFGPKWNKLMGSDPNDFLMLLSYYKSRVSSFTSAMWYSVKTFGSPEVLELERGTAKTDKIQVITL